jgi:hypothetical protein
VSRSPADTIIPMPTEESRIRHRIFGAIVAVAAEPAGGRDQRDRRRDVDQDLRESGEAVADEQAVEGDAARIGDPGHGEAAPASARWRAR